MSGTVANPIGITNPPIDELLAATDSKYSLVIYAAKRARQINAYYSQLGEGLLEYVGPLVETGVQEKPLSIALREINGGLLTPRAGRRPGRLGASSAGRPARRPRRRRGHRGLQGVRAAPAADRDRARRHRRADRQRAGVRRRADLGGPVRQARERERLGRRARGAARARSARRPTSSSSPPRPPTCSPGPRTAWPTTCSPTPCSPPAARWCSPRRCTPRCGSTRPPGPTSRTLRARGVLVIEPAVGRLTGADTRQGRLPDPAEISAASAARCWPAAARRPTSPAAASSSRAGGTREHLDPVRYLGNRSSGKQGYALARTAAARGAEVVLVAANARCRTRPGSRSSRSPARRAARRGAGRGRERRRGRHGRRRRRLPARRAPADQAQEDRRR